MQLDSGTLHTIQNYYDAGQLKTSPNLPTFEVLIWLFWTLALLTTIARIVLLRRIGRQYGTEHYLALFASFNLTINLILCQMAGYYGSQYVTDMRNFIETDQKSSPPNEKHYRIMIQCTLGYVITLPMTLWACKFSILFFTRMLIAKVSKYQKTFWAMFGCLLSTFIIEMVVLFEPVYTPDIYTGFSGSVSHQTRSCIMAAILLDLFSDLFPMVIPVRALWKLQISLRQKLSTLAMFVLGFVAMAFAGARLGTSLRYLPRPAAGGTYLLWSELEGSISVIVCNLPVFRVYQKFRESHKNEDYLVYGSSDPTTTINIMKSTKLTVTTPPVPNAPDGNNNKELQSSHSVHQSDELGLANLREHGDHSDGSGREISPATTVDLSQESNNEPKTSKEHPQSRDDSTLANSDFTGFRDK